jgi:GntR family transcriptional repressor for pyruvate dehydrogenase complex
LILRKVEQQGEGMPFQAIDIKRKSNYVAEQVIDAIKAGEYKGGDKLPSEREIAELMKVSRNSVREALSALQIAGLICSKAGDGTYISDLINIRINKEQILGLVKEGVDLLEIWKARKQIETIVINLAVKRATEENIDRIQEIVGEMREAVDTRDHDKYLAANLDFHLSVAEAAANLPLKQALESLLKVTQQLSAILGDVELGYVREHIERSFEIHERIFNTIEAHAEKNVNKQVEAHFKELIDYLEKEFISL